ncbi:Cation efflux family protein [Perilla frutescens var. hirtella]|uniref:Cation efflux family protein n=1 Tax=Perilla frutescens var. hirtella TaxID=608512 RepID=A0AAD4J4A0_PERFH|nr:Cation efflux family protein [Perilla frutescens var. frutescens]KAH6826907.1 Cation efflux family protein [Perilla frutescens var. hirtella]
MGFRFLKNLNPTAKSCISRLTSSSLCSPKIFGNSEFYDHATFYFDNPNFKICRRWHGGHGHSHHHRDHQDFHSGKEGEKIFRLGLAADIGLAAGKVVTGYVSGSTAIIADAAHSISDVVLSGVALLSFKAGKAPKDKEHPYGHGKFETLGALGISGVLLLTAGGIAWHALDVLVDIWTAAPEIVNQSLAHNHGHQHGGHHHGIDMEHPILALNMTIVSIGVKEGLYWITKKAGEKTGSGLMKANAWHHRADAISSVVALIGVGGSILGVRFLDPLAGVLVSAMIFKAGLESGYQSIMELVDAAIPSQHLEPYKRTILEVEGVKGYSHLRGRRAGSSLYLDVDVEVDPFSSVSAAHDIGENVRRQLQQSHPEVAEVFIHIEPATSQISGSVINHQRSCKSSVRHCNTASLEPTDVEDTVLNILSSNFLEKMTVQHITRHSLQGQILLQIEVAMPPDTLIREAVEAAKEAEKKILEVVPNIMHVSIQLQLGQPMPEFPQ